MASVDKRNEGWRVRWRDPDGTARSRQLPTRRAALDLQKEVDECIARGHRWEPRDARPQADLRALLKDYAEECARVLRPGTAVRYALGLDLLLRYLDKVHGKGKTLPPAILTRRMLADWYGDLKHGGLHGRDRGDATRRKIVEVGQLAWKWLYDNDETGAEIPMPRTLRMAREPSKPTVAPTWDEMDACVGALNSWQQRLGIVLRFTGLRCQQAMGLRWADVDLARSRLTVRGELGKSKQEQRGRMMPISPHLVAILRTWERDSEWLIESNREKGDRERMARARDFDRAWQRAEVRSEAWEGRPHHAFRKGFVSELKRAGADSDAVEFLVGHSLGLRGVYIDPDALPLKAAVQHIPALSPDITFDGDELGYGPLRLITLGDDERDPAFAPRRHEARRIGVCPERVPLGHRGPENVVRFGALRKRGGLAGTRGRSIRLSVTVRMAWEKREVEPAESVPREQRGEVWTRWLAEGRYRSGAELARAAGVSRETVSRTLRIKN